MRRPKRFRAVALTVAVVAGVAAPSAVVAAPDATAASRIVIRGHLAKFSGRTATYHSSQGTFSARWLGPRHYRITGRIRGRTLRGTFRTRQNAGHTSYTARGSGRLGARRVEITGH